MKVTLRERKLDGSKVSLFLDIYIPGNNKPRTKEYLKLYIDKNPKTKLEREENKRTQLLAENIRSKRLLELQNEYHGFKSLSKPAQTDFVSYFANQTEKRKESTGNYGNWDSVYKHLYKFTGGQLNFTNVDAQ